MFQDKQVFAQLVSFLNRSKFNRIVAKYNGDKYEKEYCNYQNLKNYFRHGTEIECIGTAYHLKFKDGKLTVSARETNTISVLCGND